MKNSNLTMLILSFLLSLSFFTESTPNNLKIECQDSPNCKCRDDFGSFVFNCPNAEKPAITVTIPSRTDAFVVCKIPNPDSNLLKGINLRGKSAIYISKCPTPNISFGEMLDTLGIENVKEIHFNSQQNLSDSLPKKSLSGLESVNLLDLSDNGLTYLPEDWFQGIVNLTELNLRHNNIRLRKNNFKSAPNLQNLLLTNNHLTHLESGVFTGLTKLKFLELQRNELTDLSRGVFSDLVRLEKLYMYGNSLKTLPVGVFQGLFNLQKLNLANNHLTHLEGGIFANLTNLKFLDLKENGLTTLSRDVFSDLGSLEILHISHNSFKTLPVDVFQDLKTVYDIEIDLSKMSSIPEGLFSNNTQLLRLTIQCDADTVVSLPLPDSLKLKDDDDLIKRLKNHGIDILKLFKGNPMMNSEI